MLRAQDNLALTVDYRLRVAKGLRTAIQQEGGRLLRLLEVLGGHSVELRVSVITVSKSLREGHDFFFPPLDLESMVSRVLES
ncbi:hypothetical protein PR002_g32854 [Phytophthora rubi]|uniref:Uncharacterized protein n=1 Tax=Phytophthora rubi TaxID=129364 RepID=A0A6A3G348_9STRA|nr:hypothetical protein PR002_g32854 [Phytophthora rubi]